MVWEAGGGLRGQGLGDPHQRSSHLHLQPQEHRCVGDPELSLAPRSRAAELLSPPPPAHGCGVVGCEKARGCGGVWEGS